MSSCLFGTQGVVAHWFGTAGGHTTTLVALRFIAGGVVFGTVAIVTRIPLLPRRAAFGAVLTGLAHVTFSSCLLFGFAKSSVALTVLLFYTYPLYVTVGAALLYGEPLTKARIALVALGTVGVALAAGNPTGASPSGVLFGLGAGVACTFVVLGNRALLRQGATVPQIAATAYIVPSTCFTLAILAGWIPLPPGTVDAWAPVVIYLATTVVGFFLFYTAVSRIGASLASLLATLEPLVGVILAWLLIDQPLDVRQMAGGALILGAVAALSLQGRKTTGTLPPAATTPVAP